MDVEISYDRCSVRHILNGTRTLKSAYILQCIFIIFSIHFFCYFSYSKKALFNIRVLVN